LTVVLTMNCLNGYFHLPYFDALAEELLKAEDKGAIAVLSPSGLSLNAPAHRPDARGLGMSGAVTAAGEGAVSLSSNPAGLFWVEDYWSN